MNLVSNISILVVPRWVRNLVLAIMALLSLCHLFNPLADPYRPAVERLPPEFLTSPVAGQAFAQDLILMLRARLAEQPARFAKADTQEDAA